MANKILKSVGQKAKIQIRRLKIAQDDKTKSKQENTTKTKPHQNPLPSHKQVTEIHPHPAYTLYENQNTPGSKHRTNGIIEPYL